MSRSLILTPGGYRHPSLVHHVEPGQAVKSDGDRLSLLNLETNELKEIPESDAATVQAAALGSGWIAHAYWMNDTGEPVSSFSTAWQVPPEPDTQSGQTIYLFNGISPADNSAAIIQPVLQWGGPGELGGGPYWTIASWYVEGANSGGRAFHSSHVRVSPGETVVGVMSLVGQPGGRFSYQCEFQGVAGTSLTCESVDELVWCNLTLEAYSVSQCSDYPAGLTAMRAVNLQTGGSNPALSWTPSNDVEDCGQHVVVVNDSSQDGEVDIYYSLSE